MHLFRHFLKTAPLYLALLVLGLGSTLPGYGLEPRLDKEGIWEANPYLSFLPSGVRPDWQRWQGILEEKSRARRSRQSKGGEGTLPEFFEMEPADRWGDNDLVALAEPLPGFGPLPGQTPRAQITGRLFPEPSDQTPPPEQLEGDDAIPEARSLDVLPDSGGISVHSMIGDGLYGSGGVTPNGDFDFYRLAASQGDRIEVSVVTTDPLGGLDPIAGLYNEAGDLLAFNDNLPQPGFLRNLDSYIVYEVEQDGDFVVVVGGFRLQQPGETTVSILPADPFVPGSGGGTGSEGGYELVVRLSESYEPDIDVFRLELQAGDVVGATLLSGARRLALIDASGETLVASAGPDLSALYPVDSPLPGGGLATIASVVEASGTYGLAVERALLPALAGNGIYTVEVGVFRPALARELNEERQILFLDFDGAQLDIGMFGVPSQEVQLSPLSSYLQGWGLSPVDEGPLIDALLEVVVENLDDDLRLKGGNGDFERSGLAGEFDIEIRNSRDHVDPFGEARVSRVIVGGSIEELRLRTIGIAEEIDVGNFNTESTAVVLLDLLSAPAPAVDSLNSLERAPGSTAIDLVAVGVGNIVAHEAGHLLANFHTERDEGPITLMDRGGNIPGLVGIGCDQIFGTHDDQDVDFEPDHYEPAEAFEGVEDTLDALAFGLPMGGPRGRFGVQPESHDFGPREIGSSIDQTFRVYNDGNQPLTFTSPALLEALGSFELLSAPASPLAPLQSRDWTVRFTPSEIAQEEGELQIEMDDPVRPSVTVSLTGQGGVPEVLAAPRVLDFGELTYGSADLTSQRQVEVVHGGQGMLKVSVVGTTGPDAATFQNLGPETLILEAGERRVIDLQFRPSGLVGSFQAALILKTNDPQEQRLRLELSGRSSGPDLRVDPDSFSFGLIRVGTRRLRTFRLINEGTRDLSIGGVKIGDLEDSFKATGGMPFSVEDDALPANLALGASMDLAIGFEPSSADFFEAVLRIDSDDPDQPLRSVELQGFGVEPEVVVEPALVHFSSVAIGASWQQSLTIRNEGNERLAIDGFAFGGRDAAEFGFLGSNPPFLLLPGNQTTLELEFRPLTMGDKDAYFEVQTDDADEPRVVVPLIARGGFQTPEIPALDERGRGAMIILLMMAMWVILGRRR